MSAPAYLRCPATTIRAIASTVETPSPPPPAPLKRTRRPLPVLVLEGMRPRQWTKNAFVLAGMVFGGRALDLGAELAAWRTLLAFCLVSGATYLVNDVRDADVDRHNPRTAGRPIARGDLSPRLALAAAALVAVAAVALAASVDLAVAGVVIGFFALQIAYSIVLKHLVFIDAMVIAGGFVLRAYAGALAVDVVMSEWLLACTGLLALFLAFGKRRAELVSLAGTEDPRRRVLDGYSIGLLDELIAVVTPAVLVLYTAWAVLGAESSAMLVTVPFVLYGIFRVLLLIHHGNGSTEEPDAVIWRDRALLACIVLWAVAGAVVSVAT